MAGKFRESGNRTDAFSLMGEGQRYSTMKSLILAQDER